MSDTPAISTRADLARFAREHYELVSTLACDYLSLMPVMIDEWEKFPEVLSALRAELEQTRADLRRTEHERNSIMVSLVGKVAWEK